MFEEFIESVGQKLVLSSKDLEILKPYFIPKKVRKRQYVLNAGDVCQYITFVEKGLLRSFTVDDDGHEHVVQFACEGWWISDVGSFSSGKDAMYNIEALEDALAEYEGSVLLVSHDRAFLREVATRVWAFDGTHLQDFDGPFVEWEEDRARRAAKR